MPSKNTTDYTEHIKREIRLAQRLVFDCCMEVSYGTENMTKEEIAAKLLYVVDRLDELDFDVGKDDDTLKKIESGDGLRLLAIDLAKNKTAGLRQYP